MKVKHISHVNEAILVLRHFVEVSAKLLPFLEELQQKKRQTVHDLVNREKIIAVYKNHKFDTQTSLALMHSNILDLIQRSFETICANGATSRKHSHTYVQEFLMEYRRLKQNWGMIEAN